ncbi:hypothetical protein JCM33774_70590 [Actinophytocola sp. KF-1]
MVDPLGGKRDPQRFGDVFLPDDLGEGSRPVLAVKGERHARTIPADTDRPAPNSARYTDRGPHAAFIS